MNGSQLAIIKKDFQEAWGIKMARTSMLVVPIVMVVFLPAMFMTICLLAPEEMNTDMESVIAALPAQFANATPSQSAYYYMVNMICQPIFLMIPMMVGTISAASSFVGEKERGTIESILLTPLSVRQIFTAKVLGCSLLALAVTGISFVVFTVIMLIGNVLVGISAFPSISWAILILVLCPAVTVLGVSFMVLVSSKAKTFVEAQQMAGFIVLPVILLIIGQVTGIMMLSPVVLAIVALIIILADILMLRYATSTFTAEKLLR